jgi:predicted anti-sigma-YlaC factor YlaD
MDCRLVKENMLDYAEGKASIDFSNSIIEHLHTCDSCKSYYRVVLDFLKVIDAEKAVAVNPFLLTRIEEKIKADNETSSISIGSRILKTYYYYAAVIIIGLTIGVYTGTQLGSLLNKNENKTVITSETEQLKQDFYLNDIEKDDVSQVLNNQ